MEHTESILFFGGVFTVAATGTDGLDFGLDVMMVLLLPSCPSGILLTLGGFCSVFLRTVL